jgi:hypothetical protein
MWMRETANFIKIAQLVHANVLGLSCITICDSNRRIGTIDEDSRI